MQRLLATRHQWGRKVPDLLIAAAAEASDLAVLHDDADFDRIAAVTGQPVSGSSRRARSTDREGLRLGCQEGAAVRRPSAAAAV